MKTKELRRIAAILIAIAVTFTTQPMITYYAYAESFGGSARGSMGPAMDDFDDDMWEDTDDEFEEQPDDFEPNLEYVDDPEEDLDDEEMEEDEEAENLDEDSNASAEKTVKDPDPSSKFTKDAKNGSTISEETDDPSVDEETEEVTDEACLHAREELQAAMDVANLKKAQYEEAKKTYNDALNNSEYALAKKEYKQAIEKFEEITEKEADKYDSDDDVYYICIYRSALKSSLKKVSGLGITDDTSSQEVSEIIAEHEALSQSYNETYNNILAAYRQIGRNLLNERCGGVLTVEYLLQLCRENEVLAPYMTDQFYESLDIAMQPDNMLRSVDYIREYNELRRINGLEPAVIDYKTVMLTTFSAAFHSTRIAAHTFCRQCTKKSNSNIWPALKNEISQHGEMQAWCTDKNYDPYQGWYYDEKELYEAAIRTGEPPSGETGHYLSIIGSDQIINGVLYPKSTGFAFTDANGIRYWAQEHINGIYNDTNHAPYYTCDQYESQLRSYFNGKTSKTDVNDAKALVNTENQNIKLLKSHLIKVQEYEESCSKLNRRNDEFGKAYKAMKTAKAKMEQTVVDSKILIALKTAVSNAKQEYDAAQTDLYSKESVYEEYRIDISAAKLSGLKKKKYTGYAVKQSMSSLNLSLDGEPINTSFCEDIYYNNTHTGYADIVIRGHGIYKGDIEKRFQIIPVGTKITNMRRSGSKLAIGWKRQATETSGYQLALSTSKDFDKSKTKFINANSTSYTGKTIKNLNSKKTYYIRIHTFKVEDGKKIYSRWSKTKTVRKK